MANADDVYERCYAITAWYDGPRSGIADYRGRPHFYESEFGDIAPSASDDTFLLMPVDQETFGLALEDYTIFLRWEAAYRAGTTPEETHPALPEDRGRHEEIQRRLGDRLVIRPASALQARADFRWREEPDPFNRGARLCEVKWTPVAK